MTRKEVVFHQKECHTCGWGGPAGVHLQIRLYEEWGSRLPVALDTLRATFWPSLDVALVYTGRWLHGRRGRLVRAELHYSFESNCFFSLSNSWRSGQTTYPQPRFFCIRKAKLFKSITVSGSEIDQQMKPEQSKEVLGLLPPQT